MSLTDLAEMQATKNPLYLEGAKAYYDGSMYEQNPYQYNTSSGNLWATGWCDAESHDMSREEDVY